MSPPSSTQDNLDAAAAFLRNFVTAQQQQQPQQPSPAPQAPAPAPQSQTPAYLQQLVLAAQQQYQQQQNATAPAPQPQPQPPAQPQGLDPNIAQLLAQAMNMAQQQNQRQAAAPSAAPVAPQPQPYQHMPQQQSVPTYGSAPPTSSPPAAAPTQQQQQQSLLSSAHLLGSLNPTLAAALMSSALQQSITTPAVPAAAAPPVATGADAEQPVATLPPAAHHVPSLPVPFGLTGTNAFQQHRTPPVIHSITKMQKWSLEQLESHAKELHDGGYQLPQAVAILLADARRKEEKRQAKRIANRKSACTSRARKKAKIDQLMNENAQLRRLELILSYLPDPIIVVSPTGVITFCNTQVERVFKHKVNDLVGANIEDVMIPKSRGVIKKLIRDMLVAEQELSETSDSNAAIAKKKMKSKSGEGSGSSGDRNIISENTSESAFPLLEVKLNSTDVDAAEDVSDSDENRRLASLAHKDSSFNSNEGDDTTPNSSEKEMRNALAKNVEACKINKYKAKTEQVRFAHKDDVMGASVTANNADAKLSSLMHEPSSLKNVMSSKLTSDKQEEQSSSTLDSSLSKTSSEKAQAKEGNSSEDSGYRESGESPEDSNSSSSSGGSADSKNEKRKRARPMAPSRNVCLIRSDMSSIWCELTSSIRTSIALPEDTERGSVSKEGSVEQPEEPEQLEKEILLCFRPIQEGEKVSSDLRFNHVQVKHGISESSGDAGTSSTHPASTETQLDVPKNKPLKKRIFEDQQSAELANKKSRVASDETSAVETMMELARKSLQ